MEKALLFEGALKESNSNEHPAEELFCPKKNNNIKSKLNQQKTNTKKAEHIRDKVGTVERSETVCQVA